RAMTQKATEEVRSEKGMDRRAFMRLPKAIQRRVLYSLYGLRSLKDIEDTIRSIKKGSYLKSLSA
ncbi:MAG: tRNA(Ile)-lysidine synthetase, partial [Aquificaceae bacterium]|nr:tRNA(Ile)-lysidine synthetase [Aquificaceae bacterium]